MAGTYNQCFFDHTPIVPVGSSRNERIGSTIFYEQYLAAHVHQNGQLGIRGRNDQECMRHAQLYGGSVKYGWVVEDIEQDLSCGW